MWVPSGQILQVISREAQNFYFYVQVSNFKILGKYLLHMNPKKQSHTTS